MCNKIYYSYFVFFLFFFFVSPSVSKSSVSEIKDAEDQLNKLWDLYEASLLEEPDSALYYLRELKAVALKYNRENWVASAYWAIAYLQYEQGYLGEAVYNYLEAAKIFEKVGELDHLAKVYNSIGDVYVLAKDYSIAIPYFLQAKDIFHYSHNNKKVAMVSRNLSICYMEQKSFSEAKATLGVGKSAAHAANDSLMLSMIYNSLGAIDFHQRDYESARHNYHLAIQYAGRLIDGLRVKAYAINNIGEAYLYEENYEQAEEWLVNALAFKQGLGESPIIQSTINLLGQLYLQQGRFNQAITVLEKGLQDEKLLPIDDELGKGLALIVEALVKANAEGEPSDRVYLNQKFAIYSQKLIAYNNQLQKLREELETIGKQQVVRLAVEKHSMNTKLGAAEEKNEKFKYAIIIPVFLLICAVISVYLSLRRNARYRKLYAGIEEVLGNRALRKPNNK